MIKNDTFEINTGSPHYIQFMSDINQSRLFKLLQIN